MKRPFWEDAYSDPNASAFGTPSQEILDIASNPPPGSSVLDLGSGEGRHALYLAECGFDVTAVDISEAGIAKLDGVVRKRGLDVRTEVADMRDFRFPRSYDLIVSHSCLHLIERDARRRLIDLFKRNTNPQGLNVVVVFTDRIPPPDDLQDFCVGLFHEVEVFSAYSDWQIEMERSYTIEDEHPGGIHHMHPINKLVARKA